jgi:topoisomerase IV subunit A
MNTPSPTKGIRDTPLAEALGERYLAYALSTIMSRSLPDVRDGLKPVHRRLLFAMLRLKLDPATGFKKCARVVGDVIGKYHPHGDVAVYDAMVRLAQEFAVRYPLVDGQGNFGSIDGDNAAAMRYTEARLTAVAVALLDGIDEDAVDFRETYDGEESEPVVLPARFPNLLANGASGIAVGMATSIPPHNAAELCDALSHLLKSPNATIEKLVSLVPGPDFPTGGLLVEPRDSVVESYRTGKGSFRLRARWETEKLGRGQYQIVVTEIPYQVQKSKLIEKTAELLMAKKLPLLANIIDESSDQIRLILEPRSRVIEPKVLMEQMFRKTDMETRASLNMNVLDSSNVPRTMGLPDVLNAFIEHRLEVLVRRSRYRLGKIEHRLEVLGGLLCAYLNLDEVIAIIRQEEKPKPRLIKRFSLSETQADAILNMRLRQLHKLEEIEIQKENEALTAEKVELSALIGSEKRQRKAIGEEIADIKKQFSAKTDIGRRRTEIGDAPKEVIVPVEAMIEREPITVLCSEMGWVRAAKGHIADPGEVKYKEGDREKFTLKAYTTDKILVFSTDGRFYTVACDNLPSGRGHGEPLRLMIDLSSDHDIVNVLIHTPQSRLLVASDKGRGFIANEDDIMAQTRSGKQVLNVSADEEATVCTRIAQTDDAIAVTGENRKLLIFSLDELPNMGRGKGVILQRYAKGGLCDAKTLTLAEGLSWQSGERTRRESDLSKWQGKRAQAGHLPPSGFPRSGRFSK